jgi:hypothetical protein
VTRNSPTKVSEETRESIASRVVFSNEKRSEFSDTFSDRSRTKNPDGDSLRPEDFEKERERERERDIVGATRNREENESWREAILGIPRHFRLTHLRAMARPRQRRY